MNVEIINGYEGHTEDVMVLLSEICEFIHCCLDIEDTTHDIDDLVEFIEKNAPHLKWIKKFKKTNWWKKASETQDSMKDIIVFIQAQIDKARKEVADDCIKTLNGATYTDYEDMVNVLKREYGV